MRPLQLGAALAGADRAAAGRVRGVRAGAGRGVPAARRRARRLRRPGRDRQAGRRRPARGQADRAGRAGRPVEQRGPGPAAGAAPRRPGAGRRRAWRRCARSSSATGALAEVERMIAYLHRAGGGRAGGLAGRPVRRGRARASWPPPPPSAGSERGGGRACGRWSGRPTGWSWSARGSAGCRRRCGWPAPAARSRSLERGRGAGRPGRAAGARRLRLRHRADRADHAAS